MAEPSDVIEVRADEKLDLAKLSAYLVAEKLPGAEGTLAIRQFAGGHANLTYLLELSSGGTRQEYVLRRPPLGPVAPGSHDMHREYRALSRLWRAFPPAPRAFLYCDDTAVIGAPFVVMERRHGIVVRNAVPETYGAGRDPVANRKLSEVVVDTLVDFHAVEPEASGLADLGKDPATFLERQVSGWLDRYHRAQTGTLREADDLATWLADHRPASPKATLLHNDWRLDNMALDPADPGRCVAVYDWDMCTVGDPLADLGTLLALWSNRGDAPAGTNPMPTQTEGFLTREAAVARYGERSGRDVTHAAWYDVFGTFKMAVVLQQIFFRFAKGQTQDARFKGLENAARGLFQLAASRRP